MMRFLRELFCWHEWTRWEYTPTNSWDTIGERYCIKCGKRDSLREYG